MLFCSAILALTDKDGQAVENTVGNMGPAVNEASQTGYKSMIYYTNWAMYGRNHHVADLPDGMLTHVLYSFANVRPESGEVFLTDTWADVDKHYPDDSWNDVGSFAYGNVKQLHLLKQRQRNLKVLLSIGGWTYSPNFHDVVISSDKRNRFVASAVALMEDLGFDGLDVDYEYPATDAQGDGFAQLLAELRTALNEHASKKGDTEPYYLSIACPAGPQNIVNLKIESMLPSLDSWNLMAYDFSQAGDSPGQNADHMANLHDGDATRFSADTAIDMYLSRGVPSNKIVFGMPLYGRAFENTEGAGSVYSGIGQGSWENGIWDYKALPLSGAQEFVDANIGAGWSFDQSKKAMVSYDTVESSLLKADYIKQRNLGGAFWWESSGDKSAPADSLVHRVVGSLGYLEQARSHSHFPYSKYDNIKGFVDDSASAPLPAPSIPVSQPQYPLLKPDPLPQQEESKEINVVKGDQVLVCPICQQPIQAS